MSTGLVTVTETSSPLISSGLPLSGQLDAAHPAVQQIRRYSERTGLSFMCVDEARWDVVARTDGIELAILPMTLRETAMNSTGDPLVHRLSNMVFYCLPIPDAVESRLWAVGYVLASRDVCPEDAVLEAAALGWTESQLQAWLARQKCCDADILSRLLQTIHNEEVGLHREKKMQREIDKLAEEIEQTFEEISLLHALTGNLQISRSPVDLAELCLDRLQELIPAEGNAIWMQKKSGETHFLVEGKVPFEESGLSRLLSRFPNHDWSRPLVKNHQEETLLGADFPGLKNFVIAAIAEGPHRYGWIVNYNIRQGREFGTVEASLLNSIATILGTHLRNIDLYQQHEQLLLSFVRSMVSSLDAKDPYTRGHSERVALIARRLGQELKLPPEDLQDIYLSGLLHDVGKIGISDAVLQKPGRLTDEEFEHVKRHPTIGYEILIPLENLHHVLPGVRSHHEAYDGSGYPDGLVGEETPLMARIMAVADSYDAMCSDRPYRKGMPQSKMETIFRKNAGKQWDPKVMEAYFQARVEILKLWTEYNPSQGNLLEPAPDTDLASLRLFD